MLCNKLFNNFEQKTSLYDFHNILVKTKCLNYAFKLRSATLLFRMPIYCTSDVDPYGSAILETSWIRR